LFSDGYYLALGSQFPNAISKHSTKMNKLLFLPFLFFVAFSANGMKGRLLLIGGGSEQTGGWSNPAYKWAVDKSANKRVAIIGYSSPSNFLRDYFKNSLGAVFSKDFTVASKAEAQSQILLDSLITYDVIFFRGGDQSIYYNNFKGTKLAQAVTQVFNSGGVIAGTSAGLHILSSVIYNALDESITSEEAIVNIGNSNITLANDFFQFFPGYIFDSHVAERGRFARTISFLARWYKDKRQVIKAIAMDDLTAMGIDTNQVGEVFGTGVAGIYASAKRDGNHFALSRNNKLAADSIVVKHILNGWKYNFKLHTITKPTTTGIAMSTPLASAQTSTSTILLSASESVTSNKVLINQLVKHTGGVNDRIIIVTGVDTASATAFKTQLSITGATSVNIIQNTASDLSAEKYVRNATKFVFMGNTYSQLVSFLANNINSVGPIINQIIRSEGSILAFVGDNSRFVGSRLLSDNYTGRYTAYENKITTTEGLAFLKSSIVFPAAFANANTLENSACTVPYFMMKDSLAFGIMIDGDVVVKYEIKPDGKAFLSSFGLSPAIIMKNNGTDYAFSNTTSKNNGTQPPRQIAGFDSLYISFTDSTSAMLVGTNLAYKATVDTISVPTSANKFSPKTTISDFTTYPNPNTTYINMNTEAISLFPEGKVALIDFDGKTVYESIELGRQIPINGLPKGIYMVTIWSGQEVYRNKVVIGD